jgi:hypothetical protein
MAKQAYVYSGTDWVPLASEVTNLSAYQTKALNQFAHRNLIINGDMQVAQRSTSVASITSDTYATADRWFHAIGTLGTWTDTVENDAPTGSGFRKSWKTNCTTASASPASTSQTRFVQRIEGQNVQHIKKGTAAAEQLTVSFWVKSNVTGTYIAELYDIDNTRSVSKSYTISTSGTWEYKTLTFPADTTGAFDNDNAASLDIYWWLASGTNFTSGTLNTSWTSVTNANRAVGQVNLASATSNYWQVTGVQLEVGDTATPFEFKPFAQDLEECQRYYYRLTTVNSGDALTGFGECYATTAGQTVSYAPQIMRATATTVDYANIGWIIPSTGSGSITSLTIAATGTIGNVIYLGATTGSGMSGGKVFYIRSTSAGGYIGIGCEL